MSKYSAEAAALGYLYQFRYALYSALHNEPDLISVETLDDLVEEDGESLSLIQIKHSENPSSLTISSPQVWKTLRIWIDFFVNATGRREEAKFFLVTSSNVQGFELAECLMGRPGAARNVERAADILINFASTSQNIDLAGCYSAVLSLNRETLIYLLQSVEVVGNSPDIETLKRKIESKLEFAVDPNYVEHMYSSLEGWWINLLIERMRNGLEAIPLAAIKSSIRRFSEDFKAGNLPTFFEDKLPDESAMPSFFSQLFVRQVNEIGLSPGRVETAINDYYKAFNERINWINKGFLADYDLQRYDRALVDEWQHLKEAIEEEVFPMDSEEDFKEAGRKIYNHFMVNWSGIDLKNIRSGYVMRGSFHILADKCPPDVYWHPLFMERLEEITSS